MNNADKWKKKEKFCPTVSEIHLTNHCNLKCETCWRYGERHQDEELPEGVWGGIVDQLVGMGINEVYFGGGGEPFFRKSLAMQMIKRLKSRGTSVEITSNCTLLKEEDVLELINLEVDHIQFSIDGHDEKTQDALRGKGVFNQNVRILKAFRDIKNKLGRFKPRITFHTVMLNRNAEHLSSIIELARKYEVNEVNFQELIMMTGHCKEFIIKNMGALKQELERAAQKAEELGITTNATRFLKRYNEIPGKKSIFGFIAKPSAKIRCYEPWERITIHANGYIQTCCNSSKIHETLGESSLEEIWHGKQFEELRKEFAKGKLMDVCCTHPNKFRN